MVNVLAAELRGRGWVCSASRSDSGNWVLFLCRPDGSQRRNLTATPDRNEFAPQFSRDGRKLLYRRLTRAESIEGNRYGEQGELGIANSDGSDPKTLGQPGQFAWPHGSADGRQNAGRSLTDIS